MGPPPQSVCSFGLLLLEKEAISLLVLPTSIFYGDVIPFQNSALRKKLYLLMKQFLRWNIFSVWSCVGWQHWSRCFSKVFLVVYRKYTYISRCAVYPLKPTISCCPLSLCDTVCLINHTFTSNKFNVCKHRYLILNFMADSLEIIRFISYEENIF